MIVADDRIAARRHPDLLDPARDVDVRHFQVANAVGKLKCGGSSCSNGRPLMTVYRRDLLRLAIGGVGAAAASAVVPELTVARPVDLQDKRKARYRPDSAEVRNFYRVNSYPAR